MEKREFKNMLAKKNRKMNNTMKNDTKFQLREYYEDKGLADVERVVVFEGISFTTKGMLVHALDLTNNVRISKGGRKVSKVRELPPSVVKAHMTGWPVGLCQR